MGSTVNWGSFGKNGPVADALPSSRRFTDRCVYSKKADFWCAPDMKSTGRHAAIDGVLVSVVHRQGRLKRIAWDLPDWVPFGMACGMSNQ